MFFHLISNAMRLLPSFLFSAILILSTACDPITPIERNNPNDSGSDAFRLSALDSITVEHAEAHVVRISWRNPNVTRTRTVLERRKSECITRTQQNCGPNQPSPVPYEDEFDEHARLSGDELAFYDTLTTPGIYHYRVQARGVEDEAKSSFATSDSIIVDGWVEGPERTQTVPFDKRNRTKALSLADGRILFVSTATMEVYDPNQGRWSVIDHPYPHGSRMDVTLLSDDTVLYTAQSEDELVQFQSDVALRTWTQLPPLVPEDEVTVYEETNTAGLSNGDFLLIYEALTPDGDFGESLIVRAFVWSSASGTFNPVSSPPDSRFNMEYRPDYALSLPNNKAFVGGNGNCAFFDGDTETWVGATACSRFNKKDVRTAVAGPLPDDRTLIANDRVSAINPNTLEVQDTDFPEKVDPFTALAMLPNGRVITIANVSSTFEKVTAYFEEETNRWLLTPLRYSDLSTDSRIAPLSSSMYDAIAISSLEERTLLYKSFPEEPE